MAPEGRHDAAPEAVPSRKNKKPAFYFPIEDGQQTRGTTSVHSERAGTSIRVSINTLRSNGRARHTLAKCSDTQFQNHVPPPPACLVSSSEGSL